jgi:hypothetical protein
MSKKPVQPQDKYVLRMPEGMRDRIKRAADLNNRSMNAEIISVLEERFPPPPEIELEFLLSLEAMKERISSYAAKHGEDGDLKNLLNVTSDLIETIKADPRVDNYTSHAYLERLRFLERNPANRKVLDDDGDAD